MIRCGDTRSPSSSSAEGRDIVSIAWTDMISLVETLGNDLRSAKLSPDCMTAKDLWRATPEARRRVEGLYRETLSMKLMAALSLDTFLEMLTIAARALVVLDVICAICLQDKEIGKLIMGKVKKEPGALHTSDAKTSFVHQFLRSPQMLFPLCTEAVPPLWLPRGLSSFHQSKEIEALKANVFHFLLSLLQRSEEIHVSEATVANAFASQMSSPVMRNEKREPEIAADEETEDCMSPVKKKTRREEEQEEREAAKAIVSLREIPFPVPQPKSPLVTREEKTEVPLQEKKLSSAAVVSTAKGEEDAKQSTQPTNILPLMIYEAMRQLGCARPCTIADYLRQTVPPNELPTSPVWHNCIGVYLSRDARYDYVEGGKRKIWYLKESCDAFSKGSASSIDHLALFANKLAEERVPPHELVGQTPTQIRAKHPKVTAEAANVTIDEARCQVTVELLVHLISQDPPLPGMLAAAKKVIAENIPEGALIAKYRQWFTDSLDRKSASPLLHYSAPALWQPIGHALSAIQRLHVCDREVFEGVKKLLREQFLPRLFTLQSHMDKLPLKVSILAAVESLEETAKIQEVLRSKISVIREGCVKAHGCVPVKAHLNKADKESASTLCQEQKKGTLVAVAPSRWLLSHTTRGILKF